MAYPTISVGVSLTTDRFATPSYTALPSTDVKAISVMRGRKSELESQPPGTLDVDLDNRTRAYDPRNASGTYYPHLTPGRKARLTATYDQFAGAASVSYVGAGALASGDNVSLTPALPAGWLADRDLFVCLASIRNSGTGTVNVPTGWFSIVTFGNMALLGHYAGVGDVAPTITFTGGASGDTTLAQVIALRDCEADPASLVIASATSLNASAQNIAVPALTVAEGGVVLIAGWKQDDWTGVAALTGQLFNEAIDASSVTGNDAGHVLDYRVQSGAFNVAATNLVVTGGASAISRSIVVGLRPFRGKAYQLFGGWTTAWPNESSRFSGVATMRATGRLRVPRPHQAARRLHGRRRGRQPCRLVPAERGRRQELVDESGNGHHGRWVPELADVKTTTGLIAGSDSAVSLPSGQFAVGKIPEAAMPSLKGQSIEFWVKIDKPPKPLDVPLELSAEMWSSLLFGGGVNIRVWAATSAYPGAVDFIIGDDASLMTAHLAIATTAFADAYWYYNLCDGRPHHVVCTINAPPTCCASTWTGSTGRRSTTSSARSRRLGLRAHRHQRLARLGRLVRHRRAGVLQHRAVRDAGGRPLRGRRGAMAGRHDRRADRPSARPDRLAGQPHRPRRRPERPRDLHRRRRQGPRLLDAVTATEQGLLVEAHYNGGGIQFRDRSSRLTSPRSTTVLTTFSDQAADLTTGVAYSGIDLATDDKPAANQVTVKWRGGDVVAVNQSSVDQYGPIPVTITTVGESRAEAENLAEWVLAEQSALFNRIRSIEIRPTRTQGTAADRAWIACLGLREGDRVRVNHQPASTGAVISQELWIIGISHEADSGVNDLEHRLLLRAGDHDRLLGARHFAPSVPAPSSPSD
jgi:hypothetical protein